MFPATGCIDVTVRVPASFTDPVEHWQRLRLHVGTSDTVARLSLLDRERILPGESAQAQLLPEEEITVNSGARFILRTYSPLRTIAGGTVLLPLGERPKSKSSEPLSRSSTRSHQRIATETVLRPSSTTKAY